MLRPGFLQGGIRRRTSIFAPVIVDENGDLDFFASIEDAELYLESWAVEEGFTAYDSEGRLLEIRVERRLRVSSIWPLASISIATYTDLRDSRSIGPTSSPR